MRIILIKHLSHSGFLIEDKENVFIFDPITPLDLSIRDANYYIFISHGHGDHFKEEIVKEFFNKEKIYFIISKDIEKEFIYQQVSNVNVMEPYEKIHLNNIAVETYGSTDRGNSYRVSFNGKHYFHSGDLNWWHWRDRMTPNQLKKEEDDFKKELAYFEDKEIDFAFVPVDPRLTEHAYIAVNYFIEKVSPKYVIPMHSFGEYSFYHDAQEHILLRNTKYIPVTKENQEIYWGEE